MSQQFTRNFELNEQLFTDIGRREYANMSYKVAGFWSGDTLRIYVKSDYMGTGEFSFEISDSSGGRDPKVIEDDAIAYANKAAALLDACEVVKTLRENSEQIKVAYFAFREECRIQAAEEKAAKEARIAADPKVDEETADMLIKLARKSNIVRVSCRKPGETNDSATEIEFRNWESTHGKFNIGYNVNVGIRRVKNYILENMSMACAKEEIVKLLTPVEA